MRISKLILIFLSGFYIQSCNKPSEITKANKHIRKILITKVDFDITSIISVDCENFGSYFGRQVDSIINTNAKDIKLFQSYIDQLEADSSSYVPDVRAKIFIYFEDNSVDTICMSDLGILMNGESYLAEKGFVELIEKIK